MTQCCKSYAGHKPTYPTLDYQLMALKFLPNIITSMISLLRATLATLSLSPVATLFLFLISFFFTSNLFSFLFFRRFTGLENAALYIEESTLCTARSYSLIGIACITTHNDVDKEGHHLWRDVETPLQQFKPT